jgi:hypothetical protein
MRREELLRRRDATNLDVTRPSPAWRLGLECMHNIFNDDLLHAWNAQCDSSSYEVRLADPVHLQNPLYRSAVALGDLD